MGSKIVSNLDLPIQRIQTAFLAAAIFLGALFYTMWTFIAIVLVIVGVSAYEYSKNILENRLGLRPVFFALLPVIIAIVSVVFPGEYISKDIGLPFAASGAFINVLLALLLYSGSKHHLQEKLPTVLSMLWIGIPWAISISLYDKMGSMVILMILLMIWVSDSGAFFVGKNLGKSPLFPTISPNKTVEGAIGGLVCTLLFAACVPYFNSKLSFPVALSTAVIIVIAGITGDLIESRMKRRAGIKDTGTLLPGHGGLLDRFDSFMTSICFVYLFYLFVDLISL